MSTTWTEEEEKLANRLRGLARDIEENEDMGPSAQASLLGDVCSLDDKLEEMACINDALCTDLDRIDRAMAEDPTQEEELRKVYKECLLKASRGYHTIVASCSDS